MDATTIPAPCSPRAEVTSLVPLRMPPMFIGEDVAPTVRPAAPALEEETAMPKDMERLDPSYWLREVRYSTENAEAADRRADAHAAKGDRERATYARKDAAERRQEARRALALARNDGAWPALRTALASGDERIQQRAWTMANRLIDAEDDVVEELLELRADDTEQLRAKRVA